MDASTFYALFAATCFTLVGLWWNVVRGRDDRMRRPALRRGVGGVCLSFLLPALMGLFAQGGGDSTPGLRWAGFALLAVIGCVHTAGSRYGRRDGSSPFLAVITARRRCSTC